MPIWTKERTTWRTPLETRLSKIRLQRQPKRKRSNKKNNKMKNKKLHKIIRQKTLIKATKNLKRIRKRNHMLSTLRRKNQSLISYPRKRKSTITRNIITTPILRRSLTIIATKMRKPSKKNKFCHQRSKLWCLSSTLFLHHRSSKLLSQKKLKILTNLFQTSLMLQPLN